ncbi:MAG: hypothetical protein OEW20_11965, partial [Nitrospira sp.]|nr:hypothetical protein [Nitrospira sp.]
EQGTMSPRNVQPSEVASGPSWPVLLAPQHHTVSSAKSAQLWAPPAAMAVTFFSLFTFTGGEENEKVPFPSWPLSLAPQHHIVPSVKRAQLWAPPVAMAATLLSPMSTGLGEQGTASPTSQTRDGGALGPSWCHKFSPQHHTVPSAKRAQLWLPPSKPALGDSRTPVALAAIAVTLLSPVTVWGVEELSVVPFPSWPSELTPQQDTVLSAKRAQL